jgi:glutamine cyclotransferase
MRNMINSTDSTTSTKKVFVEKKTINITVKGDIIQNMNESEMITRKINKLNKKITLK